MLREAFSRVLDLGSENFGYVTTAQAREDGVSSAAIVMMERRGVLQRVSRGVYRLSQFPVSPLGQYAEATLWPHGLVATVSHESALALYGISDVDPPRVHITVPMGYRIRRAVPPYLVVHHHPLTERDQTFHEGIPVTSVERTIRDCVAAGLGGEIVTTALVDAEKKGLISTKAFKRLQDALAEPDHGRDPTS